MKKNYLAFEVCIYMMCTLMQCNDAILAPVCMFLVLFAMSLAVRSEGDA